jgi:thiosulfate reductase cytochrome b subunit
MKKIFMYPFWLRFWHWFNAFLFFILILSGLSLHYSDPKTSFLPFNIGVIFHNVAGILLSLNYMFFFIKSIISGNYKHYIPQVRGFLGRFYAQIRYYVLGIFINEPHPFDSTPEHKFNPMQQSAYLFIMFVFMPFICISGWLLMFPELAPDQMFGMGGVWPMAFAHTIIGYMLSLFMLVHIYLGTTGSTIGELYKSIITGWHLVHSKEEEEEADKFHVPTPTETFTTIRKKIFPIIFYNPITLSGALIAILSFFIILFLMVLDFFSTNSNAYLGIITFVVLPAILMFGLILTAWGAIRENRKILRKDSKYRRLPIIDLNNPKHQVATLVFSVTTIVIVVFSIIGSFKAYEYTDSDEFCGKVCHKVMEPEYTAYLDSPHSRVGCVKCHIGSGADWYVRSKLSGMYQVYSVLFEKYSRPIPTPVQNLRPAPQTCEQCHWPNHFYSEKKKSYDFFLPDENNSATKLTMLIKVGGGNIKMGNNSGIHWNMNIANEITYIPLDEERMIIPWVKSRNIATGKETLYKTIDTTINFSALKRENMRRMDCIDCHNRPSHTYDQPNIAVNFYMAGNLIDKTLPYIKNMSVQALEYSPTSRESSFNEISNYIYSFYNKYYPDIAKSKKQSIDQAVVQLNNLYLRSYFPSMKVNWKKFPDNIGHLYAKGCFRCHDNNHRSEDGRVISKDCNVCHNIIEQEVKGMPNAIVDGHIEFIHPGGIDKFVKQNDCSNCHNPKKKNK